MPKRNLAGRVFMHDVERGQVPISAGSCQAVKARHFEAWHTIGSHYKTGKRILLERFRPEYCDAKLEAEKLANRLNGYWFPNVRFEVFEPNGDELITITLRPFETLTRSSGGPHDEGWSNSWQTYEYDPHDKVVQVESGSRGCDCDGPHHNFTKWVLDIRSIVRGQRQNWVKKSSWQRDVFAERMGY